MIGAAVKAALGDLLLTFMWIFCASSLGVLTAVISSAIGVHGVLWASLLITTTLVFALVLIFSFIGDLLGGASFNPTGTAAFYAAGIGSDTLISMALRFPAQAVGAVGGVVAIQSAMPAEYRHMVGGGPSLKVGLHTGAAAEGLLTFTITVAVLFIVLKGPASPVLKTWLLAVTTVTMIVAGSPYTGPSMNPANAFGWAYVNNRHNTLDQFYVYWLCPFVGAILAAWFFRALVPLQPRPSQKKKKA